MKKIEKIILVIILLIVITPIALNGTNEAVNIEIIPNKYIKGLISKYL